MRRVTAIAVALACAGLALTMPARAEPLAADAGPMSQATTDTGGAAAMTSAEAPATKEQKPLEDVSVTLERVLESPRYTFCHDENRPVRSSFSYGYCEYAPDQVPSCPAFAVACAKAEPISDDESDGFQLSFGPGLASVAQLTFWTVVALAVAWWLFVVGKHLYDGRSSEEPGTQRTTLPPVEPDQEGPRSGRVVDKDALLLLSRSRKAATDGDLRGAARFAHAALVRALEARGHLHVERSSTNGDYERALRDLPELRGTFRKVAGEVERSEFGQAPPSPERLQQILASVEPIVRGVALIVLFVATLSLTACQANRWERPEDGPGGDSVFRALLEQRGATVTRRTNPVEELVEDDTDTVVVMPSARLSEADWSALLDWVDGGGFLVVAGADVPDSLGVKEAAIAGCVDKPSAAPMGPAFEKSKVVYHDAPLVLGPDWAPQVLCGGAPLVASRSHGDGTVILLGSARFLSNASLASGDNARIVVALMGQPALVSLMDGRIRAGTDSPYRSMAQSGLLPALVQGLVLLLLIALARGAAFGLRRELVLPPRRAFAEHVRAVGRLYARAGAVRHALGAYAAWALDRLNARRGPTSANRLLDSAGFISRTTGLEERVVTRILVDAADARERPDLAGSPEEDRATFVALDELVKKTGGIK